MFYPKLVRKTSYDKNSKGQYYRYSYYRDVVLTDCQKRCVYCDILLEENGFEGMHLDHFRPQDFFKDLVNDPCNLVIACPKCNRLKSNHWPCNKDDYKEPSHNGNVGFLDPFVDDINGFLSVEASGVIIPLSKPADYLIDLLDLNRHSRVLLRKRRIQVKRALGLLDEIFKRIDGVFSALEMGTINIEDASVIYQDYKNARDDIRNMLREGCI